jgi:hypothetical protein
MVCSDELRSSSERKNFVTAFSTMVAPRFVIRSSLKTLVAPAWSLLP